MTDRVVSLVEDGEGLVAQAREQAMKVFSADTVDEAATIGTDLSTVLAQLTDTQNQAFDAVMTLATLPLYVNLAELQNTPAVTGVVEGEELAGELRVARGEGGRASEYVVTLSGMAEAPAGSSYVLWAQAGEAAPVRLGELLVKGGVGGAEGSVEGGLIEQYDRVLISVEAGAVEGGAGLGWW